LSGDFPDDLMRMAAAKDRRKTPRHALNRVAQYFTGAGSLPRSCFITDVSETGARLYSEAPMPDRFLLSVFVVGWRNAARVPCRLATRRRARGWIHRPDIL